MYPCESKLLPRRTGPHGTVLSEHPAVRLVPGKGLNGANYPCLISTRHSVATCQTPQTEIYGTHNTANVNEQVGPIQRYQIPVASYHLQYVPGFLNGSKLTAVM